MHIIIDGYNLIRQSDSLRRHEKQSLEAGRRALTHQLSEYKRKKGHKITVVFDGWETGSAQEERDRQGNINIIYSRRGEKADDVIKRIADDSSEETIIISSDREIASYVTRHGKTALSSSEFELLMHKAIAQSPICDSAAGNCGLRDFYFQRQAMRAVIRYSMQIPSNGVVFRNRAFFPVLPPPGHVENEKQNDPDAAQRSVT